MRIKLADCKELIGKHYGRLTILERDYSRGIEKGKRKRIYVNCLCDCGNKLSVDFQNIKHGNTRSCGCLHKEIISEKNRKHALHSGESALHSLFRRYKRDAINSNRGFELTLEQFRLLTKSDCLYCGTHPSSISKAIQQNGDYVYNGIDRIDSSKGYEVGNCIPACKRCNQAKNNMPINEFSDWIKKVYQFSFGGAA